MADSSGRESLHKIIIFGGGGVLIFLELLSMLMPRASHDIPNKRFVVEQYQALPKESRAATNPTPNWFERHFCRGYEISENCNYESSVHPSIRNASGS